MSATKPKIVVKTVSKMPAASTVAVAKAPLKKVAVAAPSVPKKTVAKKVVVVQEEEEEEEEEVAMTPAQLIASMEAQLSALRVALKVKGLTKSGKPRKQREYTGPSEAQAAWSAYVQEVREEHGYEEDAEGNAVVDKKGEPKWALSYKDAMQIAGQRRKEAAGDNSSVVSAASSVKKAVPVAKNAVATTVKTVAASAKTVMKAPVKTVAAPVVPRKSAADLKAEFLAKKAAAAAALAEAEAEAEEAPAEAEAEDNGEAVEWEFEGQTYFKTGDNLCWLQTDDGDRIWAGVFLPEENRIDDSVAEPSFE